MSRALRTPGLPPAHGSVGYRWQNTGSVFPDKYRCDLVSHRCVGCACISPALATGPAAPSPLRRYAHAYTYRGLPASCFALPWRAALDRIDALDARRLLDHNTAMLLLKSNPCVRPWMGSTNGSEAPSLLELVAQYRHGIRREGSGPRLTCKRSHRPSALDIMQMSPVCIAEAFR